MTAFRPDRPHASRRPNVPERCDWCLPCSARRIAKLDQALAGPDAAIDSRVATVHFQRKPFQRKVLTINS